MNSIEKMDPAEADSFIIAQRHAMWGWRFEPDQEALMIRIDIAISLLRALAARHPGKAAKIADLIAKMADYRASP